MATFIFNTLAYSKKLKEAGVPEKQAEVQAEAIAEIIDNKLATKQDIKDLRREIHASAKELMYKISLRFGSMMVIAVSILAAIIKL